MTTNNAIPSSLISNHPALAHDVQGCKLAVPDGTTHWRVLRHTTGRPKVVLGPDMQPARFRLEMSQEELLDQCGPGKYRIEALDQYGNPLACVTTVIVGHVEAPIAPDLVANSNLRGYASNDMRFALETMAQMSRAHSESLQSLATSQADWIKMLATAKQIPRNAAMQFAPAPAPSSSDGSDAEDTPSWLKLLQPAMPAIANAVIRNIGSWLGGGSSAAPSTVAPSTVALSTLAPTRHRNLSQLAVIGDREREKKALPAFDDHMASVCSLLTPDERSPATQILNEFVRPLFREAFVRMTPKQGVEFIRSLVTKAVEQAQTQASSS